MMQHSPRPGPASGRARERRERSLSAGGASVHPGHSVTGTATVAGPEDSEPESEARRRPTSS
eukprot:2471877-Rhodomonas_salina.1